MDYVGPQDDAAEGASASWTTQARPRIFAYLKPRDPRFNTILAALRATAGEAIVAAPGLPPESAKGLSSPSVQVHGVPLAVGPLLAEADLCLCHSGPGITARALEAGVPLALLPLQVEQYLVGRRVVSSGSGVMVSLEDTGVDLERWLAGALADPVLRGAAAESPVRARKPQSAAARIAERLGS